MNKLIHHPDGNIIIKGKVIDIATFKKKFPDYTLPEGVIGREFVQGSHHFLFTGSDQLQGEYPWKDGDKYFQEVDDFIKTIEKPKRTRKKKTLQEKINHSIELPNGLKLIEMGCIGNVWIRKQFYPKKEVVHEGHYHHHDHLSLVSSGKVLVEVEGEPNTIFTAPTFFEVDKNKKHTITALEDNTCVFCIYGLVDKEGNPTDVFNGDNSPYGHRIVNASK